MERFNIEYSVAGQHSTVLVHPIQLQFETPSYRIVRDGTFVCYLHKNENGDYRDIGDHCELTSDDMDAIGEQIECKKSTIFKK